MANNVVTRIKELSAAWTLTGWIIIFAVTSTGSLYVLNAVGGHNDDDKSHPDLQQRVQLLNQKEDLNQKSNDDKFKVIDDKLDRTLYLLDNLTIKVSEL